MFGKIFITRSGYDPEKGKHVKDPYLGDTPSLGACRPDVRKQITTGGHVFVVSGKVPDQNQFVMGGFVVAEKITAAEAYLRYPEQRLRARTDGQLEGNIIVNSRGRQHPLDDHSNFDRRTSNYIVGAHAIALATKREIELGRAETLDALREILQRVGRSPVDVVGRWGTNLTMDQAEMIRAWLADIKSRAA